MNSTALKLTHSNTDSNYLIWWPELGMGHHPAPPMDYTGSYWKEYRQRDMTRMGEDLTRERIALVRRHFAGQVVDIGIGGGRFVEEIDGLGFDVNPEAVDWLKHNGYFCEPYASPVAAITCWDSIEHIPQPELLVAQATDWVFVSMPIYESAEHCIQSRHYKPGEHLWYWTNAGLIKWMWRQGFEWVEHNTMESDLGRDGIHSYAFRRVA